MEFQKINGATPEGSSFNLEVLYRLLPACFTEKDVMGADGVHRTGMVVDFDKLRAFLGGNNVADEGDEVYDFTWVGKRAARADAASPINKTLRPCPEESVNWDTTRNLYIEGDNLEVMKLLQTSYMGKVKMIYIDPPYNTGHDFVYEDSYAISNSEFEAEAGNVDESGDRYRINPSSAGRYHSKWCSMIYSRLLVARSLLTEDGVVFISIDDHEVDNLKKICNEVFGEINLVAEIPWQSRASIQNDTDFSVNHEYICVYAKNRRQENRRLKESNSKEWHQAETFVCRPLPLDPSRFENPDNDPRGPWKADPFDAPNIRPNLTYPITNPNTGVQHLPPRGRCWRTDFTQFSRALEDGRILFGRDGNGRPQLKVFYEEKKDFGAIDNSWFSAERIGTSTNGTRELMALFDGNAYFDTPKPVSLLSKLLYLANLKDDSIVLDFFSGSATTAHAVIKANAEKGSHNSFIMVQWPEETPESSYAFRDGYRTICDIGKERIRRAGKKVLEESNPSDEITLFKEHKDLSKLDVGFRVFKVADSYFEDVKKAPSEYSQENLDLFLDNIKTDATDLDLLFGCMLQWGVELSLPLDSKEVAGCTIYNVNDGDLVACFAENMGNEVVDAIADHHPLRVVFRDSCFRDDSQKMNLIEQFKQRCGWSEEDAIKRIRVI